MRHLPEFTFGEKVVKSQILNDRHAFTFGTSCLELQIENKISNRRHGRGEHFEANFIKAYFEQLK